jgi:hypothetical protein
MREDPNPPDNVDDDGERDEENGRNSGAEETPAGANPRRQHTDPEFDDDDPDRDEPEIDTSTSVAWRPIERSQMLRTKLMHGTLDVIEAASRKTFAALRSQVAKLEARATVPDPHPTPPPAPDPAPPIPTPNPAPEPPGPDLVPAPLEPEDAPLAI